MILEFKEITNPQFKEEIKSLKNRIKNIFNKKESFMEKFSRKYTAINFWFSFSLMIISVIFALAQGFNNNFFNYISLFSTSYFLFSNTCFFALSDIIQIKRKKVKYSLSNIVEYYAKEGKNINSERINKKMKNLKLNIKQKEIVKLINNYKMFKKSPLKIQIEVLKNKIELSSLEEIKLNEKEINVFIDNLDNVNLKKKIKNLINKKLEIEPLFENNLNKELKKEEKIVNMI